MTKNPFNANTLWIIMLGFYIEEINDNVSLLQRLKFVLQILLRSIMIQP